MKTGFAAAMKAYFGVLPDQQISQFARELISLSYQEKTEFWEMLKGQGIDCEPPSPPKPAA